MIEFKVKGTTNNISRFTTDTVIMAKAIKVFLENNNIHYTTIVNHYGSVNEVYFEFIIFNSRRHNPDLLLKFMELNQEYEAIKNVEST